MKVGSLFTGIGGFDSGLEAAGMDIAWQCEQDESCVRVLRERFPKAEIYRDVREVDGRSVEPVRLLCGGFPCQDLSVAGRRAGLAGKRSGLFYEFMRLVDETAPDWVLLENVPGLLSSNCGRDMAAVVGALGNRGYWWAYRVLDSQFFGLAQRRKRVFIVASRRNRTSAAEVLFERESVPGDSPPRRETGKDVAAALTSGVATGRGVNRPGRRREDDVNLVAAHESGQGWWNESDVAGTLRAEGENRPSRPSNIVAALTSNGVGTCGADDNQAQAGHLIGFTQSSDPNNWCHEMMPPVTGRHGDPGNIAMCLNGKRGNRYDGESETFIAHALTAEGHDASEDGTGRGTPIVPILEATARQGNPHGSSVGIGSDGDPMFTLQAGKQHGVQGVFGVRRLMPVECERLQGFQDGWTDIEGTSDSARYRQLGNAVSVPVAAWIGRRIMEVDNE